MSGPLIFTPEYYELMRDLETRGWWNAGMRDAGERLLRLANLPATGTMIDVGCGSGQTMTWFRRLRPRWTTCGFDIAPEGLAAARHFGEIRTAMGSALQIPFASESADVVVTLDVLQHLPLPAGDLDAVAEMRRVLKPGGYLFIRTNAQAFPSTVDDPEHNFRKYTSRALRERLIGAGFEIIRLSRINALLGLAEIPRELRANRHVGEGYHGLLAESSEGMDMLRGLKKGWLSLEGRFVAHGVPIPFGRTHLALVRKPS